MSNWEGREINCTLFRHSAYSKTVTFHYYLKRLWVRGTRPRTLDEGTGTLSSMVHIPWKGQPMRHWIVFAVIAFCVGDLGRSVGGRAHSTRPRDLQAARQRDQESPRQSNLGGFLG